MSLTRAAAAGFLLVSPIAALACTPRDAPPRAPQRETVAPPPTPDSFLVALTTSRGPVTVVVRRSWAPHGADRFYALVHDGFYDGARFFRVVRGFVVQFEIGRASCRERVQISVGGEYVQKQEYYGHNDYL